MSFWVRVHSIKVQGSGSRVQGSGFRVQGSRFRVQGSRFKVQGSGFRVQGSRFRVQGSGFKGSPLRLSGYGGQAGFKGSRPHICSFILLWMHVKKDRFRN
jgi:hypothetical protein